MSDTLECCEHLINIKLTCSLCNDKKINNLIAHKNYQIDENRKISKRVDELEVNIKSEEAMRKDLRDYCFDVLHKEINNLCVRVYNLENDKELLNKINEKPYCCPVCSGKGCHKEIIENKIIKFEVCNACKGKGVLWR